VPVITDRREWSLCSRQWVVAHAQTNIHCYCSWNLRPKIANLSKRVVWSVWNSKQRQM